MSRVSHELVVGDVIALEPGLYRRGWGGVRVEDLVLVTDDGCEVLTDYRVSLEYGTSNPRPSLWLPDPEVARAIGSRR